MRSLHLLPSLAATQLTNLTTDGVVIGFIVMGIVIAPIWAILVKRANAAKDIERDYQMSLPEAERKVYTVQELHDLGDRGPEFVYVI